METVENIVKNEPKKIELEEIPRMKVVMKNFVVYRYIELALMILGFVLYIFFTSQTFWNRIGIGLFIQAGLMLLLDFFAEKEEQNIWNI